MPGKGFGQRFAVVSLASTLAVLPLPRAVFCVGTDGHVAIEAADASCCHPGERSAAVVDRDSGCAPACTDTPIGLTAASRASERSDAGVTPLVTVAAPLALPPAAGPYLGAFHRVGSHAIAPPRSLRTTVHRC